MIKTLKFLLVKCFCIRSHEYLIDQNQYQGGEAITFGNTAQLKVRLNYNHPVKEIVWVLQRQINATIGTSYNDWFNFSAAGPGIPDPLQAVDLLASAKILLNGHDRFATRPQTYFRLVQPWEVHTRVPTKHIYVYAFGIRPEENQPSGTCNFSRIDNAQLVLDLTPSSQIPGYADWPNNDGSVHIFATNFNVLRIMSGMGGLAYSN